MFQGLSSKVTSGTKADLNIYCILIYWYP